MVESCQDIGESVPMGAGNPANHQSDRVVTAQ